MPLTDENRGTNANGSSSEDYCVYCYKKGEFTQDFTMSQMIEFCLQFLDQWAVQTECKLSPVQAKEQMLQHFPYLKRWKEKDERTLTEKATHLLAQCENVTIASIDADGYPRPVQMSKIHAKSFNEVWMATSVGSMKVNDWISKVFAFLFNSDRSACISYIKEQGEQAFAEEMTKRKCQTIRRK